MTERPDTSRNLTEIRKIEHLDICLNETVETGDPLFEDVHLVHQALPERDLGNCDPSCTFLGKKLDLPLMIAAMTGGCEEARKINEALARVAEAGGLAFGVGSQRAMIERPELTGTFSVRSVAPSVLLLGNIGITALKQIPHERVAAAVEAIEADGLCVHINPAQEVFQREGDEDFSGCLAALKSLCSSVRFPVVGKEVGNGISREAAERLKEAGVQAIDVGGMGGTSWTLIDSLRSGKDASRFREWGIPTAAAVLEARVGLPLIATGGIRSGLHMAKAVALGADICGIALPFLRILAKDGIAGVERYVEALKRDFRIALFLTGSKNVAELRQAKVLLGARLKAWVDQRNLGG
jgi:isopentenyl-diphosphate delta-isomerase